MTQKTSTAQALEVAEGRAKYDAEVKNILAEKVILARIMKYTVSEFRDVSSGI